MNKKLLVTVLVVVSMLTFTGCTGKSAKKEKLNDFLIAEGVNLTCAMDELAENNEYIAVMTASDSIQNVIDEIASREYSLPENVYLIRLTDDMLQKAIDSLSGGTGISDNLLKILKNKINGAVFANMINAMYGSETIASTSLITWGKSYIEPEGWSENTLLYLQYPDEFSSMVSFSKSGEGVISGTSVFVKNGDKDILKLLEEYFGMTDLEYEHYSGDELKKVLAR